MDSSKTDSQTLVMLEDVLTYIDEASGLTYRIHESGVVQVRQTLDGREMSFHCSDISEVLDRKDSEGQRFIQVNFKGNKKVLFTDSLVGFKPVPTVGLDLSKLPKVVTTPDLRSVTEAITDTLSEEKDGEYECEILKKVYGSILQGAFEVGFVVDTEREWLNRLHATSLSASA